MTAEKFSKHLAPDISIEISKLNTKTLGKFFWLMADEFNFRPKEIDALIDVHNGQTRSRYKRDRMIAESFDSYRRVGLLLGIKKNLEILFPRNREVVQNWLRVKREAFNGKSAMEFISEVPADSFSRLMFVRRLLDGLRVGTFHELV